MCRTGRKRSKRWSGQRLYGAIDYAFLLQPQGVNIVSLVLGAHLSAIVLGLPPDKARAYKGPAEMKGMTIGVTGPGGAAENMLRIILNKGGLKLTDLTSVGVGSGSTAIAAMETGKIQGIVLADPNKGIYTADGRTTGQEQQNAYQQVLDTGRLSTKQPIDLKKIFVTEFLDTANGK